MIQEQILFSQHMQKQAVKGQVKYTIIQYTCIVAEGHNFGKITNYFFSNWQI